MEAVKAGSILIVLGLLSGTAGLIVGGLFWSNFIYLGISWFIAGFVYLLAEREVSDGGFLAALLLGIAGALLWLVIDMSRGSNRPETYSPLYDRGSYYKRIAEEDYKCGSCAYISKPGCKRNEQFINAEPCEDFMLSPWRDI